MLLSLLAWPSDFQDVSKEGRRNNSQDDGSSVSVDGAAPVDPVAVEFVVTTVVHMVINVGSPGQVVALGCGTGAD